MEFRKSLPEWPLYPNIKYSAGSRCSDFDKMGTVGLKRLCALAHFVFPYWRKWALFGVAKVIMGNPVAEYNKIIHAR